MYVNIRCANCKMHKVEFDNAIINLVPLVNYGPYHYVCCETDGPLQPVESGK